MAVTKINPTPCTSGGIQTVTDDTELIAAGTTLTGAYSPTGANGNACRTNGWDTCVFKGPIVKGDETTIEFRPEGSSDNGVTWTPLPIKAAQSGGFSAIGPDLMQITASALAASDRWATPPCNCKGWALVRCAVQKSGGSGPGTIGVYVSFGKAITS